MTDIHNAAESLDEMIDGGNDRERARGLRAIAREARQHDCTARIVGTGASAHVLVVSGDGESVIATRSARRLAVWLGY